MLLYFAYGSNLYLPRMQERVPSAQVHGVGKLNHHDLRFHMIGSDGTGKCDAFHTGHEEHSVWGVIYEMAVTHKPNLDRAEGLGVGYDIKEVDILVGDEIVQAYTYYALRIDESYTPTKQYAHFVTEGARFHGLPDHYLDSILKKIAG